MADKSREEAISDEVMAFLRLIRNSQGISCSSAAKHHQEAWDRAADLGLVCDDTHIVVLTLAGRRAAFGKSRQQPAPAASDGDEAATAYAEGLRGQCQAAIEEAAELRAEVVRLTSELKDSRVRFDSLDALIKEDEANPAATYWRDNHAARVQERDTALTALDAARAQNAALREALVQALDHFKELIELHETDLLQHTRLDVFEEWYDDAHVALRAEAAPETGNGGEPPIYEADRDALRAMNTNPDTDTYVITFGALRAMFADLERAVQ